MAVSRRAFLNSAPLVILPALWRPSERSSLAGAGPRAPAEPVASFPTQPAELVREMVGVSHGNLARVKELLAQRPTLSRAAYDWGFGDWEDALGAASHVGNRKIAELLLANGARPTIFSAAMLGQLDVVKGFVAAAPGIEATPGPHGITLLRHAMAGGQRAESVVSYLKTLRGADKRPESRPIPAGELALLAGEYVYGSAADERITITVKNSSLSFMRAGRPARGLTHVGDRAFFPVGAPLVRIRFHESGGAMSLTVHDPDLVLEARRSG